MSRPVGRPPKLEEALFRQAVHLFKDRIIQNSKIVSKTDKVWSDISDFIGKVVTAPSLYSIVTTNAYLIRNDLLGSSTPERANSNEETDSVVSEDFQNNNVSFERSCDDLSSMDFDVFLSEKDFNELVYISQRKHSRRSKKK